MATAPFFFPTTAPACGFFPAPPCCPTTFGAPASGFFPAPAYIAPPAFPYAATYPYPLPASAYTAATGFSPAPAYDPSILPLSTTYLYPPVPRSPPFTPSDQIFPTPTPNPPACSILAPPLETTAPTATQSPVSASNELYGALSLRSPLCGRLKLQQHKEGGGETEEYDGATPLYDCNFHEKNDSVPRPDTPALTKGNNTSGASIYGEKLVHKHTEAVALRVSSVGRPESPGSSASPKHDMLSSLSLAATTAESLGINEQSSANKNHPFSTPSSRSTTIATTTSLLFSFAPSVFSVSASTMPSTTAYVALQVFGEMPKPISCQGTHDTAPEYRSGQHTPTQSTCLPDGNNHLSEQIVDGMPQAYGLCNLNRQSVFLADGSEHSYFALPENYPLERATPVPVFDVYVDDTEGDSNESVCVLASHNGQQPYEEEQQESDRPPKCFSKPTFSSEGPTLGTVGVFSLTNEQSICDLETLNGCENLSFAKQDKEQVLKCFSKVSAFRNVPDVYVRRTGQEEFQGDGNLLWEKSVGQTATGHAISFFPWDPGATEFHVLFTMAAGATKLQCTDVYTCELACSCAIQKLLSSLVNLKKMIPFPSWKLQLSTPLKLFMQSLCANTALQVTKQRHHLEFLVMDEMLLNVRELDGQLEYISQGTSIQSPQWVRRIVTVLSCCLPSFENSKLQWDPGIALSLYMCSWPVTSRARHKTSKALVWFPSPLVSDMQIQLPTSRTSHIWDPGIESILFLYKPVHIHMIQLVDCTSTARLPLTQKSTHAKNLLSSKDYLQIWDMDIIFITFLPP